MMRTIFLLLALQLVMESTAQRSGTNEPTQVMEVSTTTAMDPHPLYKTWAHASEPSAPMFRISPSSFDIHYGDTVLTPFTYQLEQDTIEIFEYHDGHTSKGRIATLNEVLLVIEWRTGDRNEYVPVERIDSEEQ
jgi:hypothetical protein